MIVLSGDPGAWSSPDRSAVAIGVFDGVHLGHREVLAALESGSHDLRRVALTFGTHPAAVLTPDRAPQLLTTLERRLELLEDAGVDVVVVLEFDDAMRLLSPRAFVEQFLVTALRARLIAVGHGFRFGHGAAGTVGTLEKLGAEFGFAVTEVPIRSGAFGEVRSTSVRRALAEGDVDAAAALLGRYYDVDGVVVAGDGRGRQIGVPTANLEVAEGVVVPRRGVYAVLVGWGGETYDAVANIGVRPTFDDGDREVLEVHLIGRNDDLYGETLRVAFASRIRDEQRFESVDALVDQIHSDISAGSRTLRERRGTEYAPS